ncbi:MAG: 2Fe-2S iron-sulfur cluster-binding protein [bacterium]
MGYRVELLTPEGAVRFQAERDEFILDAAKEVGCPLPATCLQGWCITCAGRLLEGEADHSQATRFYPQDRQAGFVLLCCATACSNLKIRTHQADAMANHRAAHRLPHPRG